MVSSKDKSVEECGCGDCRRLMVFPYLSEDDPQMQEGQHPSDVKALLESTMKPEIITLLVGSAQTPLICHRALLAFYSSLFSAAFFSGFLESGKGAIELFEEAERDTRIFVSWAYTGIVTPDGDSIAECLRLWVLGDRLIAPRFCNAVLLVLFELSRSKSFGAADARFVYASTATGSILRLYVRDVVVEEGPLCGSATDYQKEWRELIREGNDFVEDVCLAGSFVNDSQASSEETAPWTEENCLKYFKSCNGLSAKDWLATMQKS